MADKAHKVTLKVWRGAAKFRKMNGFVNPAMVDMTSICGISEPWLITKNWECVTCKNCLKKREQT